MRDKIKGRRLNWAEVRATRFSRSSRRRHCEIGGIYTAIGSSHKYSSMESIGEDYV